MLAGFFRSRWQGKVLLERLFWRDMLLVATLISLASSALALVLLGLKLPLWLVLANLPFSLIGSIFAIAITGIGLSLGALVGLVTVFGVSARNAILLLAHYEHLILDEKQPSDLTTIIRGAQERLIPILMTAAVTALGLLPLALGLAKPGHEIEGPMAVTVLGGLLTSTLLNLVLLPVLAQRFRRSPMIARDHEQAGDVFTR